MIPAQIHLDPNFVPYVAFTPLQWFTQQQDIHQHKRNTCAVWYDGHGYIIWIIKQRQKYLFVIIYTVCCIDQIGT